MYVPVYVPVRGSVGGKAGARGVCGGFSVGYGCECLFGRLHILDVPGYFTRVLPGYFTRVLPGYFTRVYPGTYPKKMHTVTYPGMTSTTSYSTRVLTRVLPEYVPEYYPGTSPSMTSTKRYGTRVPSRVFALLFTALYFCPARRFLRFFLFAIGKKSSVAALVFLWFIVVKHLELRRSLSASKPE